jgi:CRP/FNR family nitrogen fixation transcriptional regulator
MNISREYISNTNQPEILKVTKSFRKDEAVYQQGDSAIKYYKVISGIVVIGSYTAEGKMIYKSLFHEGGFFGDEVINGLEERVNFALAFSKDLVIEEYKQDSFWINQFHQKEVLKSSLHRNLDIQHTMEVNSSMAVEDRVRNFLKGLADKKSIKLLTGEVMVRMHVKHKELAFACNSSRQCVSSIISKFQKTGELRMDRTSFVLSSNF